MKGFKLINEKTGEEILMNTEVADFRGDPLTVVGFAAPHKPSSTGRVYVTKNGMSREFFPSVIGAKIVEE